MELLGGHTYGAGVHVADPHHDAAHGYQGCGGEAVLFGPQQGGDHHVPSGFHLAVGFHHHPAAQVVHHQGLVGFRQSQLPGQTGVFDGGLGGGPSAAVEPGNQNYIGVGLGYPGGDGADTHLGHQLDVDPGLAVGVLEVVDQLARSSME
jgi:hypothetical protein